MVRLVLETVTRRNFDDLDWAHPREHRQTRPVWNKGRVRCGARERGAMRKRTRGENEGGERSEEEGGGG
jgi:hypothetical protein